MRASTAVILLGMSMLVTGPASAADPTPAAADPTPAAAATTTPPAAPAKPVNVVDGDKIVCKTYSQTGTRFPKKVCLTKAEWFYEHTSAMDALRNKHELDPHYK
jgi:endonuclease YncB( thermonuclease family)